MSLADTDRYSRNHGTPDRSSLTFTTSLHDQGNDVKEEEEEKKKYNKKQTACDL